MTTDEAADKRASIERHIIEWTGYSSRTLDQLMYDWQNNVHVAVRRPQFAEALS